MARSSPSGGCARWALCTPGCDARRSPHLTPRRMAESGRDASMESQGRAGSDGPSIVVARIVGAIVLAYGLALAIAGWRLLALHGTSYYSLEGAATALTGVLVARRKRSALVVYG